MAKIPKTFRLSEQAVQNLAKIVAQTGASDTAIVEMALAYFAQTMQGQSNNLRPKEAEKEAPVKTPNPTDARGGKQRHRHKSKSK